MHSPGTLTENAHEQVLRTDTAAGQTGRLFTAEREDL